MKKYAEVFRLNIQISLIYKWNLLITSLIGIFRFFAEIAFWNMLFLANMGKEIYGYNVNSIITYYIFMYIIGAVTGMGNIGEKAANDIKNGTLNNYVLKPINYEGYYLSEVLGQKLVQLLVAVAVFIPIFIYNYSVLTISISAKQLIAFPFILIMSLILNYLINMLITLSVFWITEATSFFFLKDIILDFLSGRAFPIDILPKGLISIFSFLPFAYCTFFSITVITKELSDFEFFKGILMQLGWILIISVLIKIVWKKGLKKYSGTGM